MKNGTLFKKISDDIAALQSQEKPSTEDSLVVIAIYRGKKTSKKSTAKVYINGYTPEEIDVLFRDIYGKVYEIRHRANPKMQELNKKLEEKKGGL